MNPVEAKILQDLTAAAKAVVVVVEQQTKVLEAIAVELNKTRRGIKK